MVNSISPVPGAHPLVFSLLRHLGQMRDHRPGPEWSQHLGSHRGPEVTCLLPHLLPSCYLCLIIVVVNILTLWNHWRWAWEVVTCAGICRHSSISVHSSPRLRKALMKRPWRALGKEQFVSSVSVTAVTGQAHGWQECTRLGCCPLCSFPSFFPTLSTPHWFFFHSSLFLPSLPVVLVPHLGPKPPWTRMVASFPHRPLSLSTQAALIIYSPSIILVCIPFTETCNGCQLFCGQPKVFFEWWHRLSHTIPHHPTHINCPPQPCCALRAQSLYFSPGKLLSVSPYALPCSLWSFGPSGTSFFPFSAVFCHSLLLCPA